MSEVATGSSEDVAVVLQHLSDLAVEIKGTLERIANAVQTLATMGD